jgi:hypothetical protein
MQQTTAAAMLMLHLHSCSPRDHKETSAPAAGSDQIVNEHLRYIHLCSSATIPPMVDEACNIAPPGRVYAALQAAGARWQLHTDHLQGKQPETSANTIMQLAETHMAQ